MRCARSPETFAGDIHDGDVFIHNDPYDGGSSPAGCERDPSGVPRWRTLLGFACLRAHWPDIGSATPGSYGAVTEIYGEGLRLPPVRLVSKGVLNRDIEAIILANVRTPEERRGRSRVRSSLPPCVPASGCRRLRRRYGVETG